MKLFTHISLVSLFFLLVGCSASTRDSLEVVRQDGTVEYLSGITEAEKVQMAKERRTELDNIRKGDFYMAKNNPKEALDYYLTTLEKIPNDIVLHKKTANAYFAMKNWWEAYKHFLQVPILEMSEAEKNDMFLALFYDENRSDRATELQKFNVATGTLDYYTTLSYCYSWFDDCINHIEAYKGDEWRIQKFQSVISDAKNISDDSLYVAFRLSVSFFEEKMYRISGMIANEILARQPNYQEVKKLYGFSLYELGKYSDAKEILLSALEANPDDLEIIIRLGEIFSKIGQYNTANLYLNNAILAGYAPKTILERQLAFNYAKIGDKEAMKKVLGYLLQEKDATEDDYTVAVSLAFQQGENIRAFAWSHEGLNKFPDSKRLVPLYIESLRLTGKRDDAQKYIDGLSSDLKTIPLVELEQGILLYDQKKYDEASGIFEALLNFDDVSDFSIEADNYLKKIAFEKSQTASWSVEVSSQTGSDFWSF